MEPVDPGQDVIKDFERVWVGPPPGQEESVDGLWAQHCWKPGEPPMYAALIQFTDDDLDRIKENGGKLYFIQLTNAMVPFAMLHTSDLQHQPPTS